MFSSKPNHLELSKYIFYIEKDKCILATPNRKKIIASFSLREVVEGAYKECIKEYKQDGESAERYTPLFHGLDELRAQYKELTSKIEPVLAIFKKMDSEEVNQIHKLAKQIDNNLVMCVQLALVNNPEPQKIHALLDSTIQKEAKQFVELLKKYENTPAIPSTQDFENALTAYENRLNGIPKPVTDFEASLFECCDKFAATLKTNLTVDKECLDLHSKTVEKLTAVKKQIETKLRATASQIRAKFPKNNGNTNTNSATTPSLYPGNKTHTSGQFQPSKEQVDVLTEQAATMNISNNSGRTSPPKIR